MGKNDRKPTTKGSWQPNPLYHPDLERRAQRDVLWQGWTLLPRNEPLVWVEDDTAPKSRPGPKPSLTDEQAKKFIDWLVKHPERLNQKQDAICDDLNKFGVCFSKTVWRERVILPAKKILG
jgi:hypothetical protein